MRCYQMTLTVIRCRHGILYNSSASQNRQFTGFRKIFGIFSLFIATIDNINWSNHGKMALKCQFVDMMPYFVEYYQIISFHNLVLRSFTNPSTIWQNYSASNARALARSRKIPCLIRCHMMTSDVRSNLDIYTISKKYGTCFVNFSASKQVELKFYGIFSSPGHADYQLPLLLLLQGD